MIFGDLHADLGFIKVIRGVVRPFCLAYFSGYFDGGYLTGQGYINC